MARLKLATVWLGGCSGCHMSFLDLDEWLIELAALADVVYSPLIDVKEYPEGVDVCLVEGAVANKDNRSLIEQVRARTKTMVSFGDCAVTGNVTALRNPCGGAPVILKRSYMDPSNDGPRMPDTSGVLPLLEDPVRPVHQVVPVDLFLPGCPPSAAIIRQVLDALVHGSQPDVSGETIRFG
jgi:NAD-reducing hydrogenase small subunit